MQFIIKIIISALIIATVSEIAKRYTLFAAVVASLPLTSILAMVWLYRDTKDVQKVVDLSAGIFWAVLPSLLFFIVFPILLKTELGFVSSLIISSLIMFVGYSVYIFVFNTL